MKKYCSLHLNSEYSFLESKIKIDDLINYAKQQAFEALVLTDHNNMFGILEFVSKAKAQNIKPIPGLDLDVEDYRLILLAKNAEGYRHLINLTNIKMNGGNVSENMVFSPDIYIIDHPTFGKLAKHKTLPKIQNILKPSKNDEPDCVFVQETRILEKNDCEAIGVLNAIKNNEEYKEVFLEPYTFIEKSNNASIMQVVEIIETCNVDFAQNNNPIPVFDKEHDSLKLLQEKAQAGFKDKIHGIHDISKYAERLNYELQIISSLGFQDYFLIIHDLVTWAKNNGIAIGPGRGSAAGSLILYLLDITEVDPIKFDLLFERFLNPQRVSMPDIDIDIQDNRRDEVVRYLFNKYGNDNVALISTFSILGAKSSLRDVARMMKLPMRDVNMLSKFVSTWSTLDESYKGSPRFRAMIDSSETYMQLFKWAKSIEGLPRQYGTHAAGIIISDKPLKKTFPVFINSEDNNQIQASMDYLEENGLIKIDLLGLRNLTILQDVQEKIFQNYKKKVSLIKIPLNDSITNNHLSLGDTAGIFQLESYGMRQTLMEVGVESIDDLIAIISLYRPGPMDNIEHYANRKKHLEPIPVISTEYDNITKNTYGILVYQEQIMKLAQEFAGMSFAEADILRRAISKKRNWEIDKLKNRFISGAKANNHNEDLIRTLFSIIERFADYGFNKSHAVAYAIIAYRMAYLKARFQYEFYASLISSSIGSHLVLNRYIYEAKSKSINVVSPNINESFDYVLSNDKKIILPLTIVKGLGQVTAEKIIEERIKNGVFRTFFQTIARLKSIGIGESILISLIESNVLKVFGNMQTLLDAFSSALNYSEMVIFTKNSKTVLEFDLFVEPKLTIQKRNIKIEIANEEKYFGTTLNAFPTIEYEKEKKLSSIELGDSEEIIVYFVDVKIRKDKNNNDFASATILDSSAKIELTIFNKIWKFIDKTPKNTLVRAQINKKEFRGMEKFDLAKPWEVINE